MLPIRCAKFGINFTVIALLVMLANVGNLDNGYDVVKVIGSTPAPF